MHPRCPVCFDDFSPDCYIDANTYPLALACGKLIAMLGYSSFLMRLTGHVLCAQCARTLISDGSTCPLKDSERRIEEQDLTIVALMFEAAGEENDIQSCVARYFAGEFYAR